MTEDFINGLYFAVCQRLPNKHDIAELLAVASSPGEALAALRGTPEGIRYFSLAGNLSFNWITNMMCIGARPTPVQAAALLEMGITAFLDLTYEPPDYAEALCEGVGRFSEPIKNDVANPPDDILRAARVLLGLLDENKRTYLHCNSGRSRSAYVAAIIIAVTRGEDFKEATRYVRLRRPTARPFPLLLPEEADAIIEDLQRERNQGLSRDPARDRGTPRDEAPR